MARLKRRSDVLEMATLRVNGLSAIDENLDLGNGQNLEEFKKRTEKTAASLGRYNTLLAESDEAKNVFERDEQALADFYTQMLIGVAARYGKNSDEYEKAGGVRKEERKRRTVKPKPDPTK